VQAYEEVPEQVCLRLHFSSRGGPPSALTDQAITYAQLMRGAAGYAGALAEAGILPGEVVVLILQHGEALPFAFFGASLHGAVPAIMPFLTEKLSPEKYRTDLAALIDVTRPAAIITYQEFENEVRAAMQTSANNSVRAVLLREQVFAAEPNWPALSGLWRGAEQIALLQHSSGTTGLQKGVALSHQAIFNQLETYTQALKLTASDVVVSWLPLYHDMGLIAGFLLPLLWRVPLVLLSPFDWVRAPYKLLQAVSNYGGTLTWLPNFAFNFCAQKIRSRDLEGVNLASWRAVINCSEPMQAASHQMFAEKFAPYGLRPEALATCYAMAENVFAVTQGGVDEPVFTDEVDARALRNEWVARPAVGEAAVKLLSAGRPLPNVQVRVLDETRRELPERRVGELALKSDCLLTEYFNRPDVTEKAFYEEWYLTGDFGYMVNGEVFVIGRKKELIIVGGKNVCPQDLERLAEAVAGVHPGRAVAFGVADAEAGTEEVVLVAEVETAVETEREQIANAIRQRVTQGSDITLRHVFLVNAGWLIKTSSGKNARLGNKEKWLVERGENR
jgi:acyl-CoA synthetase (AMP-forming)/AMP-acid ligase II